MDNFGLKKAAIQQHGTRSRRFGSFELYEDDTVVTSPGCFVSALYRQAKCQFQNRIRGRNKSATSLDMRNRGRHNNTVLVSCLGMRLFRSVSHHSVSISLFLYLLFFLLSRPLFLFYLSRSLAPCPTPTWHPRSLHQAPISRAHRFACHPVGGRSNQSRSRRAARPFSKFSRCLR